MVTGTAAPESERIFGSASFGSRIILETNESTSRLTCGPSLPMRCRNFCRLRTSLNSDYEPRDQQAEQSATREEDEDG